MALFAPDIGPPAGLVARFKQRRGNAGRLQPDGQRQPAKSRADDDGGTGAAGLVLRVGGHAVFLRSAASLRQGRALRIGMGGLPVRMVSRSRRVKRPA